jgi:HAD superfamily hydrolase (TIGR01509 family)
MPSTTPPAKAALLDVDGTLVDSNDAHAMAWLETLTEFDYDVTFDRVRELIGKGGDKLLHETIGIQKESPEGAKVIKHRALLFKKRFLAGLRPFPGVRELAETLRVHGYRLVVATSATREEIDALLEIANVRDLIDDVRTSSDAKRSKPDPDIVEAALSASHCRASEAVMLGDTPYDVEAAAKANVITVALRCGGWSDEALSRARAIYDDPRQLLREFDTSPFAAR